MTETIIYGIDKANYYDILTEYYLERNDESNESVEVICADRELQTADPESIDEMIYMARQSSLYARNATGKHIGISHIQTTQGYHAAASILHGTTSITTQTHKAYRSPEKAIFNALERMNEAYTTMIIRSLKLQK